jgi:hypothetical protein
MVEVSPSAAYIRKHPADDVAEDVFSDDSDETQRDVEEIVWLLLRTPQTLRSLGRAAPESATEPRVNAVLGRWLRQGLIELSPDA